jgi:integrase
VSKTRRPRWIELQDDLYRATLERLAAREDRDAAAPLYADVTADRLWTAIARACRDSGTPHFSPHALRHRRISLMHRNGLSWAEIGERVGQRSRLVTADTYSHALIDNREVERATLLTRLSELPGRVQVVPTPVLTPR